MDQLMKLIKQCPVFIPILTRDYLKGPFAHDELKLALRQIYAGAPKRVVPVLVQGAPEDYIDHFLGGWNMVQAQDDYVIGDFNPATVSKIAHFALGVSMSDE